MDRIGSKSSKEEESGASSKRRKDKENTNKEQSEKQAKKRFIHHEWQQTEAEIIILLDIGTSLENKSAIVNINDQSCHVKLPDGREWQCNFFRSVVSEGTRKQHKSNKLILKMIKKVPHESWSQLEKSKSCPDNQTMDAEVDYDDNPVFEVPHVKHSFYEKGQDLGVLHVYVKNIVKDSVDIQFDEKSIVLKWQTTEKKFLSLHEPARDDTIFMWKVNVKESILPDQCSYKLSSTCLELTLKKKASQRWGALEPLQKNTLKPVPANTWVPVTRSSPVSCIATGSVSSQKLSLSEKPKEALNRKMQLRSEDCSSNLATKQDVETSIENISASAGNGQKEQAKKPTCMVSPLNKSKPQEQVVIPGFTGLDNLGNTCFMNSGLQCLANTREFTDYFLDGTFQAEINTDNPLGTGGKLAVAFAVLLKVLWSGTLRSYAPAKLKTLIGMKAAQFTGFAQHDAQEFMAFLLDGLHEDLNRIKMKPYVQTIESSEGRLDEEVAEESWQQYKRRNDSIVVDLFQGQYKSKLVCPVCRKVSITFDPFLYLSVPLPKKMKNITVFFFSKDPSRRPVKYLIKLPQDSVVEDLKEKIFFKTGVHPSNQRVLEAYKSKIHKFFGKGSSLSSLNSNDNIFIFEVLDERLVGEPVLQLAVIQRAIMPKPVTKCSHCKHDSFPGGAKLRRCTKCYRAAYCNQTCQKNHWVLHKNNCKLAHELIGQPFILSLPESQATFSKLVRLMDAYSRHSVDVFQPPVHESCPQKRSPFSHSPESCRSFSELRSCQKSDTTVAGGGNGSLQQWSIHSSQNSSSKDSLVHSHTDKHKSNIESQCQPLGSSLSTRLSTSVDCTKPAALPLGSEATVITKNLQGAKSESDAPDSGYNRKVPLPESTCTGMESGLVIPSRSVPNSVGNQVTKLSSHPPSSQSSLSDESHIVLFAENGNTSSGEDTKSDLNNEKDSCQSHSLETNISPSLSTSRTITALEEMSSNVSCNQQPLTRVVFGHPKHEQTFPPFYIRTLSQHGANHLGVEGETLEDKGVEPLDLSSCYYIAMDWKNNEKMQNFVLVQSKELEHDCAEQDAEFNKVGGQNEITLDQCLQLFTEPEVLSPQEAWYCPQCKDHREATKQLSLWRLPTVLIIQLKRFSFKNLIWRDKIDKMVEFPVRGLDLSPYFCGPPLPPSIQPLYDLFAVINHHGGILGGHYTAFCRCVDLQNIRRSEVDWRLFDDSRVMSVEESSVATRAAYVLFYRRRGISFSLPLLLPAGTKAINKEQKQRENQMETDLHSGHAFGENPIMDSNLLAYAEEERGSASIFTTPDMDMVD